MIAYFDTSALVPLLVSEATSQACGEVWDSADRVAATRLAYVEAVAALSMAERMGRITGPDLRAGRDVLDELWAVLDVIEIGPELMSDAARLAVTHGLRGYDATHCAAAVWASDGDLVAVTGDARLLQAWRAEGLATFDTNA